MIKKKPVKIQIKSLFVKKLNLVLINQINFILNLNLISNNIRKSKICLDLL